MITGKLVTVLGHCHGSLLESTELLLFELDEPLRNMV
jgi:hypothetical protein